MLENRSRRAKVELGSQSRETVFLLRHVLLRHARCQASTPKIAPSNTALVGLGLAGIREVSVTDQLRLKKTATTTVIYPRQSNLVHTNRA